MIHTTMQWQPSPYIQLQLVMKDVRQRELNTTRKMCVLDTNVDGTYAHTEMASNMHNGDNRHNPRFHVNGTTLYVSTLGWQET